VRHFFSNNDWVTAAAVAANLAAAFDELIRQAAQGEVLHNDPCGGFREVLALKQAKVPAFTGLFL
jgi:hypothetical protein